MSRSLAPTPTKIGATTELLLTSGGVTNASIRDALVDLLGKPIAESTALCIPTAMYGHHMAGPGVKAWQFISGRSENPMVGEEFVQWRPPSGGDSTSGLVDFSICPHLAQDGMPGNSMAVAEEWAAGIGVPWKLLTAVSGGRG